MDWLEAVLGDPSGIDVDFTAEIQLFKEHDIGHVPVNRVDPSPFGDGIRVELVPVVVEIPTSELGIADAVVRVVALDEFDYLLFVGWIEDQDGEESLDVVLVFYPPVNPVLDAGSTGTWLTFPVPVYFLDLFSV